MKGGRRKELFAMREEGKRTSEGADGEAQHPRVRMDKRATEGAEDSEWAPQPRVRAKEERESVNTIVSQKIAMPSQGCARYRV